MTDKEKEVAEMLEQTQRELEESTEETPTEEIETAEEVEEVEEEPTEEEVEESTEETTHQEDYKKRYVESTREAQKLYKNSVKVSQAIDEANKIQSPTDEDMMGEYSEWELMSDTEQRLAKENYINKKRFEVIHNASQITKNIQEWNTKVDEYIEDPKTLVDYPELDGLEEEFKLYSTGKEGIGTNFDILVAAFLHNNARNKPAKKKGKMIEVGSGGPNDMAKQKTGKISITEAQTLMRTDYNKYKEYLLSGKIDMEV